MNGIRVNFSADGAEIDFNSEVEDFWPTVQNTTVFTGQKLNTDKIFSDKGTGIHKDAVSGGLSTAGSFLIALKQLSNDAAMFTQDTEDEDNNQFQLRQFSLELDSWLGTAAHIKVGAKSTTGEEINTNYTLS